MQTEGLHNQPASSLSMNFFEHPKEEISSKETFFFLLFNTFLCFYISLYYISLYNNQINAHTLIGQSAMGYCSGKPMEKL